MRRANPLDMDAVPGAACTGKLYAAPLAERGRPAERLNFKKRERGFSVVYPNPRLRFGLRIRSPCAILTRAEYTPLTFSHEAERRIRAPLHG